MHVALPRRLGAFDEELVHDDRRQSLVYGHDFVTYGDADQTDVDVTGPLLFVGHGVTAAERDDYRGLDAAGKVAIAFAGAPPSEMPGEQSYLGLVETKSAMAAAHGAVAVQPARPPLAAASEAREALSRFASLD